MQAIIYIQLALIWLYGVQGGGGSAPVSAPAPDRYSRQVYTVGARAHSEIRKSVVYVDGPMIVDGKLCGSSLDEEERVSGLMVECLKNLALSGVGEIVLILEDSQTEDSRKIQALHKLFCEKIHLDDLGTSYLAAARVECGGKDDFPLVEEVIAEYIRRLNPQVKVSMMQRYDFINSLKSSSLKGIDQQKCYICIDRPESTQILLSSQIRSLARDGFESIKFISVETHGFYGRLFCDFGDNFKVVDEDGESPRRTLVRSIEPNDDSFVVHCEDGEKHDVSKGDIIQFTTKEGDEVSCFWEVEKVVTPFLFSCCNVGNEIYDLKSLESSTITRIKQPHKVPFLDLADSLRLAKSYAVPGTSIEGMKIPDNHQLFTASDLSKSFDESRKNTAMAVFSAFSSFIGTIHRSPSQSNDDFKRLMDMAKSSGFIIGEKLHSQQEQFAKSAFRSFINGGKLVPIQAFFGALAAQEALKSVSALSFLR